MEEAKKDSQIEEIKPKKPIWKDGIVAVLIVIFGFSFFAKQPQQPPQPFEYRPIIVTNVVRALNTVYTPSATRVTAVTYPNNISSNLTITGGQSGTIDLQISDASGANYQSVSSITNNNTGTLIVGIATTSGQGGSLIGFVPPGCSYKFVSTGTSTFTAGVRGQEVQL